MPQVKFLLLIMMAVGRGRGRGGERKDQLLLGYSLNNVRIDARQSLIPRECMRSLMNLELKPQKLVVNHSPVPLG